jgi:hypothetical protein
VWTERSALRANALFQLNALGCREAAIPNVELCQRSPGVVRLVSLDEVSDAL